MMLKKMVMPLSEMKNVTGTRHLGEAKEMNYVLDNLTL